MTQAKLLPKSISIHSSCQTSKALPGSEEPAITKYVPAMPTAMAAYWRGPGLAPWKNSQPKRQNQSGSSADMSAAMDEETWISAYSSRLLASRKVMSEENNALRQPAAVDFFTRRTAQMAKSRTPASRNLNPPAANGGMLLTE